MNVIIATTNATCANSRPANTGRTLGIATTIAGSANPANIRKWAEWLEHPIDRQLLAEVIEIFAPVKNIGHVEGLPENN